MKLQSIEVNEDEEIESIMNTDKLIRLIFEEENQRQIDKQQQVPGAINSDITNQDSLSNSSSYKKNNLKKNLVKNIDFSKDKQFVNQNQEDMKYLNDISQSTENQFEFKQKYLISNQQDLFSEKQQNVLNSTFEKEQDRKHEEIIRRSRWSGKAYQQAEQDMIQAEKIEKQRKIELERLRLEQEEQARIEEERVRVELIKQKAQEQQRNDMISTLQKSILNDFIDEYVKDIVSNQYDEIKQIKIQKENLLREQEEIEQEKIRYMYKQKIYQKFKQYFQQKKLYQKKQLEDHQLEKENIQKMFKIIEEEKEKLKKISEDNERQRQQILLENEQLRNKEIINERNKHLKLIELAEEQEAEKLYLQKIAKEKIERLRILQQQENESEELELLKIASEKLQRQKLLEQAQQETERIRQLKIKNAQLELQRLQNLRIEEEEKLRVIKEQFEIEEQMKIQQIKLQQEEKERQLKQKEEQEELEKQEKIKQELKKAELQDQKKIKLIQKNNGGNSLRQIKIQNNIRQEEQKNAPSINTQQTDVFQINSNIKMGQSIDQYDCQSNRTQIVEHDDILNMRIEGDLNEVQIEKYCDKIFKESPIKFVPQKGNQLEEQLVKLIKKLKITIPIIHIRQQIYLIGASKVNLEYKFSQVMIRIGGGIERFEQFITKNHRKFEKIIVENMSKSQESLSWVIDAFIRGDKIKKNINLVTQNINQSINQSQKIPTLISPQGKTNRMFSPVRKVQVALNMSPLLRQEQENSKTQRIAQKDEQISFITSSKNISANKLNNIVAKPNDQQKYSPLNGKKGAENQKINMVKQNNIDKSNGQVNGQGNYRIQRLEKSNEKYMEQEHKIKYIGQQVIKYIPSQIANKQKEETNSQYISIRNQIQVTARVNNINLRLSKPRNLSEKNEMRWNISNQNMLQSQNS